MIDFSITDEEKDVLKAFKDKDYLAINQLLISNSETDIALLSDEVEKEVVTIKYDRESIIDYLDEIKTLYRVILKKYYNNKKVYNTTFYRGSNLAEIEMLKISPYIDKFIVATIDKIEAENKFSTKWNRPASMNITLNGEVPYLQLSDVIKGKKYAKDIIISPFTKVRSIEELPEKKVDKNSKTVKIYNVEIEKQELDGLSEDERKGLYRFIIDNSVFIKRKLEECIRLEKENAINYENIRKLEQLLNKYDNNEDEEEDSYEENIIEKNDDIERINIELNELKKVTSDLFEIRKENINFVNMWKRNIAVYMIAECYEIEKEFTNAEDEEETAQHETVENTVQEVTNEIVEDISKKEKVEEKQEDDNKKKDEIDFVEDEEVAYTTALASCNENISSTEKMLADINNLISKQQNHAKIAGNIGVSYSALNNAFDMRNVTESLLNILKDIKLKIEAINADKKEKKKVDKFKEIAKHNLEINTLLNYINNPKIAVKNTKATRFDEMAIIEENELKRAIAEKIREIRGEAELRKLKDDIDILSDKNALERFIGLITGRNKLDEFMMDQISLRQKAIRKTLSRKMSLAYNYSIHELIAEINIFINDNLDDELVEDDVKQLKTISEELRRNFIVSEFKVNTIVDEKEHRNLPVEKKKLSKREIIEVETYRFLNKYGYDISYVDREEPKYQDTMAHEIGRVVEYINSSNIL